MYISFYRFKKIQILAQNPKGVGFREKCEFVVKTNRNSIFFGCKAHIPDQLHIIVPYISFYGFYKFSNFGSKFKGISLWFTENRQFVAKPDRTYAFLGCNAHIRYQIQIMVSYISFHDSNFGSKSK
jgi:hypothetical protein